MTPSVVQGWLPQHTPPEASKGFLTLPSYIKKLYTLISTSDKTVILFFLLAYLEINPAALFQKIRISCVWQRKRKGGLPEMSSGTNPGELGPR